MIALDSNLFIYFLAAHPDFGEQARRLFVAVEQTTLDACASELVHYEVLAHSGLSDTEAQRVAALLAEMDVRYRPITSRVLYEAAALRRAYNCGPMDSIHLASALQAQATHFVTNDKHVLKKSIPGIILVPLDHADTLLPATR